jgi:hypothetical protein
MGKKNENLHIPQPKKNIYVLNIIIQNILEKIGCEGNGPQRNTQNLNTPIGVQKIDGCKNLESNLKETK